MAARVTGTGPAELKALAAKVRAADPALKRDLRRNLRGAAAPAVRAAQASILSMPSHHDGTLRGEIARTVTTSTRITASGIAVDVTSLGSRMPAGKQNLNGYTDQAKGWRHPAWGHGPRSKWTWVRQIGAPGWFSDAVAPAVRDGQQACQDALDATARRLS